MIADPDHWSAYFSYYKINYSLHKSEVWIKTKVNQKLVIKNGNKLQFRNWERNIKKKKKQNLFSDYILPFQPFSFANN